MTHTTEKKQAVRKSLRRDIRIFNVKREELSEQADEARRNTKAIEKMKDAFMNDLNNEEQVYVKKVGPQTEAEWHMFFIGTRQDYRVSVAAKDYIGGLLNTKERQKRKEEKAAKEIEDKLKYDLESFKKEMRRVPELDTLSDFEKQMVDKYVASYREKLTNEQIAHIQEVGPQTYEEWDLFFRTTEHMYSFSKGLKRYADKMDEDNEKEQKEEATNINEEEKEMTNQNTNNTNTEAQAETKNNGGMKMKFEEFKAKKMAERNANKTKGGVNMKEVLNKTGKVIIENTPVTNKKMDAKLDPIREELKHNEVDSVTNSLMIQMLAKEMGIELPSEEEVREFAREMVEPVKEEAPAPAPEQKEEAPKKMSFMEKMKAKAEQAKAEFKAGYEEERYKGMSDRETREAKKKAFINQMYGDTPAEEVPAEEASAEEAPAQEAPKNNVVADYTQGTQTSEVDPLAFGKPLA